MALQVTYYEVKDPAVIRKEFAQTPIFIGTATKKVVVPMIPGVYSLAIPKTEAGTKYRDDIFESTVKYWKIFGQGTIFSISPTQREIEMYGQDISFNYSRQQLKTCILFILYNNSVIFSTPLDSLEFTVIDKKFFTKYAHLLFALPSSLPTMDYILASPQIEINPPYFLTESTVNLEALPNELIANNLDTIIEAEYSFYYDIVDFRWTRIRYQDALPSDFEYNKHSKLSMAAMLHRRVSTADMTLYSVPEESLSFLEMVLSEVELNPYKYGYAFVPLWTDPAINNTLKSFVESLDINRIGFQTCYISTELVTSKTVFGSPIEATSNTTYFDSSYGMFYGYEYGKDSD